MRRGVTRNTTSLFIWNESNSDMDCTSSVNQSWTRIQTQKNKSSMLEKDEVEDELICFSSDNDGYNIN